jgi:hypothetical protein
MRRHLCAFLLFLVCPLLVAQQAMNNDAVVRMVKAGLSDTVIIESINASTGSYDTSPNGLIALKQAGVSDKIISAIVLRGPAAPPKSAEPSPGAQGPSTSNDTSSPAAEPPPSAASDSDENSASGQISPGARIVIAPMGGFETYFAAAVREKKVPVTLTLDKTSAQFFVVSTDTNWEGFVYGSGAAWSRNGGAAGSAASSTRGTEASIMLIDARTKDVVWAYEVHKNSHGALLFGTLGARGEQSVAEACAKHLREYIEKGK